MGDNSPGGIKLKEFSKLLAQEKNIEKEVKNIEKEGTKVAHKECQPNEMQDVSDLPKKPFNVRPVTWSRSPSPRRYNRKRSISPSSSGNDRKRVFAVRPENRKVPAGRSKVSSDKSSKESNDPPKSNRIDSTSRRQDFISRGHRDQRSSKEREGTGYCQTDSLHPRPQSLERRREKKLPERSGNKKSSNQRSRSRSPRREKNLAPKEMQDQP